MQTVGYGVSGCVFQKRQGGDYGIAVRVPIAFVHVSMLHKCAKKFGFSCKAIVPSCPLLRRSILWLDTLKAEVS